MSDIVKSNVKIYVDKKTFKLFDHYCVFNEQAVSVSHPIPPLKLFKAASQHNKTAAGGKNTAPHLRQTPYNLVFAARHYSKKLNL